jgi:hypothetical protein
MADPITGERVGGFVVLVDEDGLRHAIRCGAVVALFEADGTGSDTIMQLTGGRAVTIRRPVGEVLEWFR